jgi:type VI secretion system Hcp family effector
MKFAIGRRGLVLLAVVAALGLVAGIAYSAIPDSGGVYTACVQKSTGAVRLIDPSVSTNRCTNAETQASWNQVGQQGAKGATGVQGVQGKTGATGPQGPKGEPGASGTGGSAPIVATVQIDGVKGGDSGQDDTITALAYSWSVSEPATHLGGGGGTSKPTASDFQIVKKVDAASPVLLVDGVTGRRVHDVEVDLFKDGATDPYVTYQLENVFITLVKTDNVTETVNFDYDKLTERYQTTKTDGTPGPVVQGLFDQSLTR